VWDRDRPLTATQAGFGPWRTGLVGVCKCHVKGEGGGGALVCQWVGRGSSSELWMSRVDLCLAEVQSPNASGLLSIAGVTAAAW
jgi:hypothetical protein